MALRLWQKSKKASYQSKKISQKNHLRYIFSYIKKRQEVIEAEKNSKKKQENLRKSEKVLC